jgi:hypothetical protein
VITRDAVDILMSSFTELLNRENTIIISSFAQTQKIFQTVYYPKILTFSMQLSNLAETLHKLKGTLQRLNNYFGGRQYREVFEENRALITELKKILSR